MPLMIAPLDVELTIVKLLVDDKTKKHLESLGITISSKIRVNSKNGGNLICIVKEGRLALDSSITSKIFVA